MTIMYIANKVYKKIIDNVPYKLPESGGILGGYNNIIYYVEFDNGIQQQNLHKCHYAPNVEYLNKCIEKWSERQIDFYGIFHTHFYGISTLSKGDKQYIKNIMHKMPPSKIQLYFPVIVLPERKMIPYLCIKEQAEIRIVEEEIQFV